MRPKFSSTVDHWPTQTKLLDAMRPLIGTLEIADPLRQGVALTLECGREGKLFCLEHHDRPRCQVNASHRF
jgi:hypothetical protein